MTTSTIHHRPAPFIAAAAAVTVFAAGALAVTLSHDGDQPGTTGQHAPTTVQQGSQQGQHFLPTTSGGRVMLAP